MGKVFFISIILLLFTSLLSSATMATNIEDSQATRIVSLSPAITEAIYLLGIDDRLVGVTTYCRIPLKAAEKERVGTIVEVDIERIIRLKPDMIFATTLMNERDIKRLKRLGIDIRVFDMAKGYKGLCEILLELGRLTGRIHRAEELIETSNKRIDAIKRGLQHLPRVKVFVQLGVKPLFAATREHFINDLIDYAGGINVFRNNPSGAVSKEEVIMKNPDVILVTTMGLSGEEEKRQWQRYRGIDAVKNNRVYLIDSDTICSPTPVSFAYALEVVAGLIHPEAQGKRYEKER